MFGLKRFRVSMDFSEIVQPGLKSIFEEIDSIIVHQQFTTSLTDFLVLCEVIWKKRVDDPEGILSEIVKGLDGFNEMIVISSDRKRTLGFVKGVYNKIYTELFMHTTKEFLCFIEYPVIMNKDHGIVNLIGPPKEVMRLMEFMKGWGAELEIMAIKEYHSRDRGLLTVLSDKQLKVTKYAYKKGFFDHPRKTDARKISSKLGMKHTTFLTHIRKAQKRMLDELFGD